MKGYVPLLVVIALLNSAGQILIKKGAAAMSGIPTGRIGEMGLAAAKSGWMWTGLVLYGFSFVLWLFVLSRVELSFAYPFLSLSYVLLTAWGAWVWREGVDTWRIAGIACIVAGILCIAQSARS